jgi:hypothetical protein
VSNFSDEMLTFETSYNASTIPRKLRVMPCFRLFQAYHILHYYSSVSSSALEKTQKWFQKIVNLKTGIINFVQYSFEGLTPSAEALRMIEEICNGDDAKLQTSFYAYDGCKSNS